ncbi:vesicular glutamate transporter 3-like isoform X1 [Saccostrea cucullata]|uniref:vesicular glutamate transporter 3-like isoform X1 n=1 Tax=Saccostrea cuccullata TaxID=36930 RepID=UPI002ED2CC7B
MGCPKRAIVVLLSFLGFLILFGFRTVITIVMVYVIKDNDNDRVGLFKECTINGTAYDLQLDWSVATSQYFNTAYFVGYVITQLPGGFLAVRFSPTKLFGGAIMISGSCFVVLAFIMKYSPIIVFVIRFIQGLAEGVSQPAMSSVVSAWAPKSERTRIVGISFSGIYLSTSLASVIAGATTCYVSWHAGLFIYGGSGILWSLVWFCTVYDSPMMHPTLSEKERRIFTEEGSNVTIASAYVAKNIPWRKILTSVPVWALLLANFTRSWVFAMIITEIPQYYADAYALNVATIGFLTSFPSILMTFSVVLGGIITDKMIKEKKVSTTLGRKISMVIGFGLEAVCVLALGFVKDYRTASAVIILAEGLAGFSTAGFKVNTVDLAPQYASVLTGIVRSGVLGATVSTAIAGILRHKDVQSWQKIFFITGSLHLFSVIFYSIFGSGQQQEWAQTEYTTLVTPKEESKLTYGSTLATQEKNSSDLTGIVYNFKEDTHNDNTSKDTNSKLEVQHLIKP